MNNQEEKRCKQCGAILVGKSKKIGLCSNCARKDTQTGAGILGVLALIGTSVLAIAKALVKKD